jgi:hypothetical protein
MILQPIIILHLKCCSLQGKSQIVQEELVKLGRQMVSTSEGTRALGLELCREFEEKFLQHLTGGEVSIFYLFLHGPATIYVVRRSILFSYR